MRRLATLLLLFPTAAAAQEAVTFGLEPSAVGDALEQSVGLEMRIAQTERNGTEIVERSEIHTQRRQRRRVTATAADGGRIVQATVEFSASEVAADGRVAVDPVVGKSYVCRRAGDSLQVTTPDGRTPPIAEFAIVSQAMAGLGVSSPLADYLAGRTVAVGETLELPAELARKALGLSDQLGEVERFTLTLRAAPPGAAEFDAQVEAAGYATQQMRLSVAGKIRIEPATCRVLSADLGGPVAISVKTGYNTTDAAGRIRLAIASAYHDAPR